MTRTELRADCTRCAALCCVGFAFASPADFALAKPAGTPCPHLGGDDRCGIHARLAPAGFPGCVAYDCLGAGQRVTAASAPAHPWRGDPVRAGKAFRALSSVGRLHELLVHLDDAAARPEAREDAAALAAARARVDALAARAADGADVDLAAAQAEVAPLLLAVSARVRGGGRDLVHANLTGADLRGADLRGADLRGALLLGADLRRADLRRADLIGADLRGADLRGADLRDVLYLLPTRLAAARTDATTRTP